MIPLNERFNDETFAFGMAGTAEQLSGALTKSLPREGFSRYREWVGVKPPPEWRLRGGEWGCRGSYTSGASSLATLERTWTVKGAAARRE